MNYFAHAVRFLDDPYFMAGTAVPDWLNVVDRSVRVRTKQALAVAAEADARQAAVARGIAQHLHDDAWFHATPAFSELCWKLTVLVRDALPGDDSLRPSFLGHILVELLLDADLAAESPQRLEAYYLALDQVDPTAVEEAVQRVAGRPAAGLAEFIPLFCRERFLWDYGDDAKLWYRLNQVMRRVGLPPLPEEFRLVLPEARRLVGPRTAELLTPAQKSSEPGSN